MSNIGRNIGQNLKTIRHRKGLSMSDLADRMSLCGDCNVTAGMIGTWQRGQRNMLATHLQYAAAALDCTVANLYDPDTSSADRIASEWSRLNHREQETLIYIATEWDGDVHALLQWVRMYVSIPRNQRTDVAGLAINQYWHLVQDGMTPVLDVDLKSLQSDCDRIERMNRHG